MVDGFVVRIFLNLGRIKKDVEVLEGCVEILFKNIMIEGKVFVKFLK